MVLLGPQQLEEPSIGVRDASIPAAPPQRQQRADAKVVVVVGNGMVGFRFCQTLARLDPAGRFCLKVLGEEPRPAYDRIHLSDCFTGKPAEQLSLADQAWYDQQQVELHTGDPVVHIDRAQKRVVTRSGRRIGYDLLVLATGSAPFVPPIEGTGLEKVFVYRTVEDAESIRAAAQSARSAAVIGGGLLGLEAAQALRHLGLQTNVIEFANGLMPRQLDMTGGQVLREQVEQNGVSVLLRAHTQAIVPTPRGLAVRFANRPAIEVDLVVISAGIRPRDELAKAGGLETAGNRGGVIIDDQLRTSDPDIFAIGECAIHRGKVYGLAAPGYAMADTLARRLMGNESEAFTEGDLSTRLKLVGVTVAVFGRFDSDCRSVSFNRPGIRRSLLVQGNRLIGAVVVGDWDQIPRLQEHTEREGHLTTRMIDRFRWTGDLFRGTVTLPVTQWPANRVVCNCMHITRGKLDQAIVGGACDFETLTRCTAAGTVCGSCRPLLAQLVDSPTDPSLGRVGGRRTMMAVSLLALAALAAILAFGPVPLADRFESRWYQVDKLWRVGWIKQTTGFTLLGVSALALVLSLRKRVRWLRNLGNYGWYRVFHTTIGLLCLAGLAVHTGLHMGENLNFWLMIVFLALIGLGAVAGVVTAVEARAGDDWALRARRWRRWLTWAHIVLFWPLPVLVGFHIAAAYLY